jgi:uncharacterized protein
VRTLRCLFAIALAFGAAAAAAENAGPITWERNEQHAFERAQHDKRFVLLYLEAVWCHWCHVMDHDTYANPAVVEQLAAHYVPLRIDQDSRPDLANRYKDYGWPATVVFAADGTEIVKRRGYIPPERMQRLLAAIVTDPSPESVERTDDATATAQASELTQALRNELLKRHRESFDATLGGLDIDQKYLDRDSVEYSLALAQTGDKQALAQARKTLDAARALIDPVWGGVYQYSTNGDWQHPHFEKLGALQAEYLRVYALAYAITGEPSYLQAAQSIRRYIDRFLASADGGYFVSQDADLRPGEHSAEYFALDDAERRKQGIPRVDPHRYAREAGAIAESYAYLYEVTGDRTALDAAVAAVRWAQAERALPKGGFRHDAKDSAGPYLADAMAMGRALLQLYRATGERTWLTAAGTTADFIESQFRANSGYASAARGTSPIAPIAQIDENIALARFANLLARYTAAPTHQAIAKHALQHLARRDVALSRLTEAGILLADTEINGEPIHLTVIGPKADTQTAALFDACLRVAGSFKRLDWWDRSEGPLPNPDVNYPPLKKPAAFVCTNQRCSTPILKPEDVAAFLAETATD